MLVASGGTGWSISLAVRNMTANKSSSLALQCRRTDYVVGSSMIQVQKFTLKRGAKGGSCSILSALNKWLSFIRTRFRGAGAGGGSELLPEHVEAFHKHLFTTQTALALDLLQLNLLPSIIAPVWHYGICAEKKCVSIQLAPSKTNTTCHSGLSQLSYPAYHMLVCSNTLFTFLLANYLLLSVVCLGAGRSVMGESQPFSN